jgi:predicted secreted protein
VRPSTEERSRASRRSGFPTPLRVGGDGAEGAAATGGLGLCRARLAAPARAVEDAPDRRVGFAVERSRDVANDWVTAVLSVTHEDAKAAEVAARINRDMTWAMGIAKARTAVRTRSGGYSTYPIHDPKRGEVRQWRGTQEIVLESGDVDAVTALVGELQAPPAQSLNQRSPERRRGIEQELVAEAQATRRRARTQTSSDRPIGRGPRRYGRRRTTSIRRCCARWRDAEMMPPAVGVGRARSASRRTDRSAEVP